MRIMIDTNIMISAILFPSWLPAKALEKASLHHTIVLCSYGIEEIHIVFERKFKDKCLFLERFLSKFSFELVYTPLNIEKEKFPDIRDPKDLPILVSAILDDVDIIISGDKDFLTLELEKPVIVSAKDFIEKFQIWA